jgi:hypothetical protein
MQDDEKMALHDMLLVTADRAEECGFSGLADQMCVWAAQIGSRIAGWSMALSHPVTPNDVANAVNMPVFLPGCGPRSGRTSRMLCEAVAAAMNGLTVIVRASALPNRHGCCSKTHWCKPCAQGHGVLQCRQPQGE